MRYFVDVRHWRAEALQSRPHWLLALTLPFSRNDHEHTPKKVAVLFRLRRERLSGLPAALISDRCGGK